MKRALLLLALLGCNGERGDEETPAAEPAAEASNDLSVSRPTRFDPAVEKDALPENIWICDMGTVHYARPDHGDGECPICGMQLVEH